MRWVQFEQPPGVRVSIPHQRNTGVRAARGEIIVFTDAGCRPEQGWLPTLSLPYSRRAHYVRSDPRDAGKHRTVRPRCAASPGVALYVRSVLPSTLPSAARPSTRSVVSTRDSLTAPMWISAGVLRMPATESAAFLTPSCDMIGADGGARCAAPIVYGKARVRLYRKHRTRLRHVLRDEPMMIVYPVFLLGLPLTLFFPFYPALLLIPAWRNRSNGAVRVLVDHLTYGVGVLAELVAR